MKKLLLSIIIIFSTISCKSIDFKDIAQNSFVNDFISVSNEKKFENHMKSYKLMAKIKTNKGDINIYLYPEAAPETVANFVFLTKKNFYDNMIFHRVLPNQLIQTGDIKGDSTGTAGYLIKDEFSTWLNFDSSGMLAMANAKEPNTASSQFFITLTNTPQFNNSYTVFGSLVNKQDLSIARSIRVGDVIKDIEISGNNVNTFLDNFKDKVSVWEANYKR